MKVMTLRPVIRIVSLLLLSSMMVACYDDQEPTTNCIFTTCWIRITVLENKMRCPDNSPIS